MTETLLIEFVINDERVGLHEPIDGSDHIFKMTNDNDYTVLYLTELINNGFISLKEPLHTIKRVEDNEREMVIYGTEGSIENQWKPTNQGYDETEAGLEESEPESVSLLSPAFEQSFTLEESLISLVQTRPSLWDSQIPLIERSKSVREKYWLEIYNILKETHNVSLETIQKKWKNLKDTFIKTKSEVEAYVPSGSGATKKKKAWKHYESLKFLGDTMVPRKTFGNYSENNKENNDDTANLKTTPKSTKRKWSVGDSCKDNDNKELEHKIGKSLDKFINTEEVHVCHKISELLLKMPIKERSLAEIKLLKLAYDLSESYL